MLTSLKKRKRCNNLSRMQAFERWSKSAQCCLDPEISSILDVEIVMLHYALNALIMSDTWEWQHVNGNYWRLPTGTGTDYWYAERGFEIGVKFRKTWTDFVMTTHFVSSTGTCTCTGTVGQHWHLKPFDDGLYSHCEDNCDGAMMNGERWMINDDYWQWLNMKYARCNEWSLVRWRGMAVMIWWSCYSNEELVQYQAASCKQQVREPWSG